MNGSSSSRVVLGVALAVERGGLGERAQAVVGPQLGRVLQVLQNGTLRRESGQYTNTQVDPRN